MLNDTMKTQMTALSNAMRLSILANEPDGGFRDIFHLGKTFFCSAALLPKGEFLGWQLSADKEAHVSTFVFSSGGAGVTPKDFSWLFEGYATVDVGSPGLPEDFGREFRKVYALYALDGAEKWDPWTYEQYSECCAESFSVELFEKMAEAGAVIRILAESDGKSEFAQGEILILLPDAITLRMRSALSKVFPGTVVREPDGEADAQGGEERLSGNCLDHMAGLLWALMPKVKGECTKCPLDEDEYLPFSEDEPCAVDEPDRDETGILKDYEGDEDDFEDSDDEGNEGSATIDDMELSIRSYNCLKRAGINSIEELRRLKDEDFMRIRNLGRKSMEEIKQKLAEFLRGSEAAPKTAAPDYSAMLEELIGLKNVKEQVRKIRALARMKLDMAKRGTESVPIVLNMEFVGNPGTAKTTVARILAGIFHEAGILPCEELVEVGRGDLVAEYIGQTAIKVKAVFRRAKGKLLFIDEAYSLLDDRKGSFGDEAITTIVQEMENNRDDMIVVFAGYPDEMESFFARNPGLKSRVPFKISFQDYSAEEMVQIAEMEARKRGFAIQSQAKEKLAAICGEAAGCPEEGNGRFCRNLVESAVLGYAARVYGDGSGNGDREFALAEEDFTFPSVVKKAKKAMPLGFRV